MNWTILLQATLAVSVLVLVTVLIQSAQTARLHVLQQSERTHNHDRR